MLFNFEHELVDDLVHVLDDTFPADVAFHFAGIFLVESPIRMNFGYVLKLMIKVVIV